jgi:hypothetical protein
MIVFSDVKGIWENIFFCGFVICGFANSRDRPKNKNKNVLGVTPDHQAPGPVLRPQQYQVAPQFKILSPWRTGSQDVWTSHIKKFLITYLSPFFCFFNFISLSPVLSSVLRSQTPPNHLFLSRVIYHWGLRYLWIDTVRLTPRIFQWGGWVKKGADPEATYNLCLILKSIL